MVISAPCLTRAPMALPASLVNIFIILYIPINCCLSSLVIPLVLSSLYRNVLYAEALLISLFTSLRYWLTACMSADMISTLSLIILSTVCGFILSTILSRVDLSSLMLITFSLVISIPFFARIATAWRFWLLSSISMSLSIAWALDSTALFNESPMSFLTEVDMVS